MSLTGILATILGLALLMVVHELGHHLVARAFNLRVIRFSIGFGPAIWKHQPKDSETVYQLALIPFLAYVQIAGMNPFEEADPEDKGSYANATLSARILTIFAGPLANYLFASVIFLAAFMSYGKPVYSTKTRVEVMPAGAAQAADMRNGDEVVRVNGKSVATFEEMREIIVKHPGEALRFDVLRAGSNLELTVTPEPKGENGGGQIGVRPGYEFVPVPAQEALKESFEKPAEVVRELVIGLVQIIRQKEKADVGGPVRMVKYGAMMMDESLYALLFFLAKLSAYLGGFNLLPLPGLDGGRLTFLIYEAVARRKPNQRIEAQIHALGLIMFLALIAVVTVQDFQK
jgi:regulator of sigma E protease